MLRWSQTLSTLSCRSCFCHFMYFLVCCCSSALLTVVAMVLLNSSDTFPRRLLVRNNKIKVNLVLFSCCGLWLSCCGLKCCASRSSDQYQVTLSYFNGQNPPTPPWSGRELVSSNQLCFTAHRLRVLFVFCSSWSLRSWFFCQERACRDHCKKISGNLWVFPSTTQHPSYGDCLEVRREYYQNSSVLDCVTQCLKSAAHLCEQFLQFQQIGFVTLGPLRCA